MKVLTPEISWHAKEAVFSIAVQPSLPKQPRRLATAGLDNNVRIWQFKDGEVKFLSNLSRHDRAVNIVRFANSGLFLASAGDDGNIFIWKLSEKEEAPNIFDNEGQNVETWCTVKVLRGHLEDVNDLSWSKDDRYLVSGSVDHTAILWDMEKGQKMSIFNDAKHFVHGVALDPQGAYVATMSCDRALRIYSIQSKKMVHCVSKMNQPCSSKEQSKDGQTQKMQRIFHDETVVRRRLSFTCDGKLLITPAGCLQVEDEKDKQNTQQINTVMLFGRNMLSKPCACLPNLKQPASIVSCCPTLFTLRQGGNGKALPFKLNYRNVFAIATNEDVLVYDTQHLSPFAMASNIHYASITDLSWSPDGKFLCVSSRDGFCSIMQFDDGEIGEVYKPSKSEEVLDDNKTNDQDKSINNKENIVCTSEGKSSTTIETEKEEAMDVVISEKESAAQNNEIDTNTKTISTSDVKPRRVTLTKVQEPQQTTTEIFAKSAESPKAPILKVASTNKSAPRRIQLTPVATQE
uniref:Chromatin assembly factor 1 subunit B-like n=1 Tax=Phallusia mammillata TaxID=59560 RepID=A0A6F9D9T2_9ASCI|nr:chromatin assembly factor 1 subunit B-like [Phallusia mammillata]